MRMILLALLVLMAAAPISAANEEYFTNGQPNGRWWLALDEMQRMTFIHGWRVGYETGFYMGLSVAGMNEKCDHLALAMDDQADPDALPRNMKYSEIEEDVTNFYTRDASYRTLSVVVGLTYVKRKAEGASTAELDSYICKMFAANRQQAGEIGWEEFYEKTKACEE